MKKYIEPKMRAIVVDVENLIAGSDSPGGMNNGTGLNDEVNNEPQLVDEDFGWDDEEDGINWKW